MKTDLQALKEIFDITEPWTDNSISREPWIVTLPSGRTAMVHCPTGAAVQIEDAGYDIRAGLI